MTPVLWESRGEVLTASPTSCAAYKESDPLLVAMERQAGWPELRFLVISKDFNCNSFFSLHLSV